MAKDTIAIGLATVTLVVTAYVALTVSTRDAGVPTDVKASLDRIEERLTKLEDLRTAVDRLDANVDRRMERVERRVAEAPAVGSLTAAAEAGEGAEAAPGANPGGAPLDELVARIEEKIDSKMDRIAARQGERNAMGEWKAPLDELEKELGLDERQKREAAAIFDEARDETFVLLKTMRLDGGSLLDDFAAALKEGQDPPTATRAFFQRILSDEVPGTDRTYLADLLTLRQDVKSALAKELSATQMTKLDRLRVDLLDVKTGHDPVGDYVRARVQ